MNPLASAEFFISINQYDKAKVILDLFKPIAIEVDQIDALGNLYAESGYFNDSLEMAKRLRESAKDQEHILCATVNMIRSYQKLNRPDLAINLTEEIDRITPNDHANMMDKAMCLLLLNRRHEAEKLLRTILVQSCDEDMINRTTFNLGTYDLLNGNFKEGLKNVLVGGRKINLWNQLHFSSSQKWNGEIQPGKTIVLCAEGGIGDEIVSVRFMRKFEELGMNAIWYTKRKDLADVFNRCGFKTMTDIKTLPEDWIWTNGMATPVYLDVDEKDLWHGRYISSNKTRKLPTTNKKRIGIKYCGNPGYEQDVHRTVPLDELLACIPKEYEIYSFHIDEEVNHSRIISLKNELKTWDDTLNYIDEMDIIVSSCTSLIHAAGAIGKKSVVFVPILSYYVWNTPEEKTPWYGDNMAILRQIKYDGWNEPLSVLKGLL